MLGHIFSASSGNFYSSYGEVTPVSRYCFVRMVMGLAGSSSATTIPAPPFSVCAVSEPSVK